MENEKTVPSHSIVSFMHVQYSPRKRGGGVCLAELGLEAKGRICHGVECQLFFCFYVGGRPCGIWGLGGAGTCGPLPLALLLFY